MRETSLVIYEIKEEKLITLLSIRFDNFDKLPAVGDCVFLPKQYWVVERHFSIGDEGISGITLYVQDQRIVEAKQSSEAENK